MVIKRIETEEELDAAWQLRKDVFVDEQNVPVSEELDDLDHLSTTIHVLATDEEGPTATGRILLDGPGRVHLGRICVAKRTRGSGLGRILMSELERIATEEYSADGKLTIDLSAQDSAQGFYGRLGYEIIDDRRYLDAGIWHRDMRKIIAR